VVSTRGQILREVMSYTGITQSQLSSISGVKQPSISQYVCGRIEMSDTMLSRLLACMGYQIEIVRRPVAVEMNRSVQRSWQLHRQLSTHISRQSLDMWRPTILRNLDRLRRGVQGQPHVRNIERWQRLVENSDVAAIRRVMTGLDDDSVQMREVSPLGGLLPQEERTKVFEMACI
jgi:transcriptional regulator with XRE-family HTH domain